MSSPQVLPIHIEVGRLPLNYATAKPKTLFRDIIARMRGRTDFLIGTNTLLPSARPDLDLYFNSGNIPYYWNRKEGQARAVVWTIANSGFLTTLTSNPDTFISHTATFPDPGAGATKTVAMLVDVLAPRATSLPTGTGTIALSDAVSNSYFWKLSGNVTIGAITIGNGSEIAVGILNSGTSFTVDWTGTSVKWPNPASNASPPTQPTGSGAFGFYVLRKVNSVIYGRFKDYTPFDTSGTVTPGGDPPKNYGGSGNDGLPVNTQAKLP